MTTPAIERHAGELAFAVRSKSAGAWRLEIAPGLAQNSAASKIAFIHLRIKFTPSKRKQMKFSLTQKDLTVKIPTPAIPSSRSSAYSCLLYTSDAADERSSV